MKVGFLGFLTLIFIALKLAGILTWSWLWVLAGLWIPLVLWILFVVIGAIIVSYK